MGPVKQNYIGQIAEVKMGKVLKDIDRAKGGRPKKTVATGGNSFTELLKTGIKKTDRQRAYALDVNEDAIEEVITEGIMENELVVRKESLPATIEELREFVIVTKRRIEAHKVQIDAIQRLGLSKSVYDRKMKETQYMSETVLWAEAKMGKLLKEIPRTSAKERGARGGRGKKAITTSGNSFTELQKTELQKTGIKPNDILRAQTLAENEDAIEEVVEEEVSRGKLPTREKVLRKVREHETVKYRESMKRKAKSYGKEMPLVVHDDFYEYCMNVIEPNSINHIITDPPYPAKYLYLYSQLGEVAQRVLKPSGFCMTYAGTYYLKETINRLSEHGLEYYWLICMRLTGAHARVHPRNMYQGFRGVLMFRKKLMEV